MTRGPEGELSVTTVLVWRDEARVSTQISVEHTSGTRNEFFCLCHVEHADSHSVPQVSRRAKTVSDRFVRNTLRDPQVQCELYRWV